jgi:hypothetical protein
MAEKFKLDLGKLAQGSAPSDSSQAIEPQQLPAEYSLLTSPPNARDAAMRNPEVAWMVATRGLQSNLIRSLQDYRTTWRDKKAIAAERQRLIEEVTVQYVDYLREEAKLASNAALKARDAVLRQELAKLRANLFTELADISGRAVVEIETIFQEHAARIHSPLLQEAYARFIMTKVFDLLEQSQA